MTRTLAYIDALPPQLRAEARRKAEQVTLKPAGTADRIIRVLLLAPDNEFSMPDLVRRTHFPRSRINSVCTRLELLGFITIRRDHNAPPLQGGAVPRWVRITTEGLAVAVREGIISAGLSATPPAGPHVQVGQRP